MNIYDTKIIRCDICGNCIGEVHFDANIIAAKCGQCSANDKQKRRLQNNQLLATIC